MADYLPEASGSDVTLADLATHTSGYPRLPPGFLFASMRRLGDPYSAISTKAIRRAVAKASRRGAGAARSYRYSNFGYGVLGQALAVASGQTFDALIRSRILQPLALTSTTFDVEDGAERLDGHDPRGHRAPHWHNRSLAGCGSIWSSIQDLYKYLHAHLDPEGTPLAAAIELVGQPRAPAGPDRRIALGWHLADTDAGVIHWHNGGTGGFGAFLGFNPEARVGLGLLMNRRHGPGMDAAAMRLLGRLAPPGRT